jgi:radical SAM protein with 4Fe4S-binding SPASM domain
MKGVTPGGEREPLMKALPLEMPYLIQIFPVYACNFRCGYCIHALDRSRHGYISDEVYMPFERYKKVIDDIKSVGKKIKMLRFAAIGEPLLHPRIPNMVEYAVKCDVADSVDIVTNASLLTHELSDKLINAGLSKLRISLEGVSSDDYREHSSAQVDYDRLVENIGYFYEHAGNTKMYIKIIDYMVQDDGKKERFFQTFSPITHDIAIEHLTPTISEIDYDDLSGGMKTDKPQNGEVLQESQICPQPFYMMQINPDGNVVPCCSMKYPRVLGNVDKNTVQDIWRGAEYKSFCRQLLDGVEHMDCACRECRLYLYDMHAEDRLDEAADRLKVIYSI